MATGHEIRRLAVVGRAEAAMRLLNAVPEYNLEHGTDIRTIACHVEPDRDAWFVREADEAVSVGAPVPVDPGDVPGSPAPLDHDRLEGALVASRADAVWTGWGSVAEHIRLATRCEHLGIVFVGPPADVLRRVGDRIEAKRLAEAESVPVVPWCGGPAPDLGTARLQAEQLGYPLIVTSTVAGGVVRPVARPEDLDGAWAAASAEAGRAGISASVLLERHVADGRHVEVQVVSDGAGTVWAVGLRDCSLRHRNRTVIAESGSPVLPPEGQDAIRRAGVRLAVAGGLRGAATVEFLHRPADGSFAFLALNPQLPAEHPVTEETTGVDLVKLQLHVARGGTLDGAPPAARGHAMGARLHAGDPVRDFAPAPGVVTCFRPPSGPGIRVETGVAEGDRIVAGLDGTVARVIAWGRDRTEARARLTRAIRRCRVVVDGGTTDKSFVLALLEHPDVIAGSVDTGWLDRRVASGELLRRDHAEIALLLASTEAYDAEGAVEQAQFYTSAARGRPELGDQVHRDVSFRFSGHRYGVRVSRTAPDRYRVRVDDSTVEVGLDRLGPHERRLVVGGARYRATSAVQGPWHLIEVNGISHSLRRDQGGIVRAPAPAVVVSVAATPGAEVAAGEPLVVVESMKLETAVGAPFAGRVVSVLVRESTQVDAGAPLVEVEPATAGDERVTGERIRLPLDGVGAPGGDAGARARSLFGSLRAQLVGYDADDSDRARTAAELAAVCAELGSDHPLVVEQGMRVLEIFADICALSRRHPDVDTQRGGVVRSARDYLIAFLRSPERAVEHLPATFLARLESALSYYGVEGLERSPELEEALVWMYRSNRRLRAYVPVVAAILDRRLEAADREPNDELRAVLDRLIAAAENRYESLADLAREVRYVYVDKPLLEQARRLVYAEMGELLDRLVGELEPAARSRIMDVLVACPQPLAGLLLDRFGRAEARLQQLLLEVLIRRFYRIRDVEHLTTRYEGGHPVLVATYRYRGDVISLVATYGDVTRLSEMADRVTRQLGAVPEHHQPVVELYLSWPGAPPDADDVERDVAARLGGIDFGRWVRRIDVVVLIAGNRSHRPATRYFTYRQGDHGLSEERCYRGLHPMLGKRNDLWRLANFAIERLPSVEDVYLFRGVAHGNRNDERLFALAEVRDLTPVVDADGAIVALPDLERMLMECLAAIRHFQSHRTNRPRLFWNQVVLHVRPPWAVPAEAWTRLARRLTPATRGLGLEKTTICIREPAGDGSWRDAILEVTALGGSGLTVRHAFPGDEPIEPLTPYRQLVVKTQRRGAVYPYELVRMLTPPADTESSFPPGGFQEHDLVDDRLVPVDRPPGENTANLVVGVITNTTAKHPEGMARVVLIGDPSRSLGALAEPECRRILGALELARREALPVEWYALSSGARISMTSGTENMDWIGAVLRGLIEFTQDGGEVNVVVTGVNVGAQPYWNAEATMLMHTRGILVMVPESAMVLTGKQALDFSGGVSAEDNLGIGGYDVVMGPNGQAQYFAPDLTAGCHVLYRYYEHSYVAPGERFPRRALTTDPVERDVGRFPHPPLEGSDFTTVGDIFSETANPERKKPFDIRTVMRAVTDADHEPLERWRDMLHAEMAVVWDAHVGGIPVTLLGFESHPVRRRRFVPADGPARWTAGTLFPMSSKKTARAINAASGRRPVVVLANLSGFDGSPESMRRLQLEFGAEIGRAVTNFAGPIVFCVISRYHGGAFVVFSKALNASLEIAAVEGSRASVIGGAPAAAVVFAREAGARTDADPRVVALAERMHGAKGAQLQQLRRELEDRREQVRSEKLGEVADEFDAIHDIERARAVGSVDRIIPGSTIRPYLVDALERGMAREQGREPAASRPGARWEP